ncbi:hypothetical protein M2146_002768 [Lachnospiraceae bacterium PF1-22]
MNDFRIIGSDALRPKKEGRKLLESNSTKKQVESIRDTVPVDIGSEHIKELEDELLELWNRK